MSPSPPARRPTRRRRAHKSPAFAPRSATQRGASAGVRRSFSEGGQLPLWPADGGRRALEVPPSRLAGVDEAGRGPWAGPVVAAAVILPVARLPVRIDDSKRLTALQRARAFEVIAERAHVGFGIVCAEGIDRRNILHATLEAMRQAVCDLPSAPDAVLVDGHLAPPLEVPCYPIIRGDQRSYVIACASIMAKVLRDRLMTFYHDLDSRYAFDRHKGYGTSLHAQRLRVWGVSLFHRRSFAPVREALCLGVPLEEPVDAPVAAAARTAR
ncbi:MAG: ribonuclease HII [Candidatus Omnitrophica bacterium]|nr:ribonuclease HII [Candidatus Omnitrophota bacterium]